MVKIINRNEDLTPKWISVEDRYPEIDHFVFLLSSNGSKQCEGQKKALDNKNFWLVDKLFYHHDDFKYWHPL